VKSLLRNNNNNNNNDNNNNKVLYYYCPDTTAIRPIAGRAQERAQITYNKGKYVERW
jgi:hypothetical protein